MFLHFASHWLSSCSVVLLVLWNLFCRLNHLKPIWNQKPCLAEWLIAEAEGRGAGQHLPFSHLPAGPILVGHRETDQSYQQMGEPPLPQCSCSRCPQYRCQAINSGSKTSKPFGEGVKTVFNSRLSPVSSPCREHQLVLRHSAGSEVGSVINSSSGYCYRQDSFMHNEFN